MAGEHMHGVPIILTLKLVDMELFLIRSGKQLYCFSQLKTENYEPVNRHKKALESRQIDQPFDGIEYDGMPTLSRENCRTSQPSVQYEHQNGDVLFEGV